MTITGNKIRDLQKPPRIGRLQSRAGGSHHGAGNEPRGAGISAGIPVRRECGGGEAGEARVFAESRGGQIRDWVSAEVLREVHGEIAELRQRSGCGGGSRCLLPGSAEGDCHGFHRQKHGGNRILLSI